MKITGICICKNEVTSDESNVQVAHLSGNTSGSTYNLVPTANWNGIAHITVTVTDNGLGNMSNSETYTLAVNSVNDAPVSLDLSNKYIDENIEIGAVVGLFSTSDPDILDSHTYMFLSGGNNDNSSFIINGDTIKTNVEIDYEVKNSYKIIVQSDDGNGGIFNQQFIIGVNDIDETSIDDIKNKISFEMYPNPVSDLLRIELENPDYEKLLLEIVYSGGKVIFSRLIDSNVMINLSEFANGLYFVRLAGKKVCKVEKLIINK